MSRPGPHSQPTIVATVSGSPPPLRRRSSATPRAPSARAMAAWTYGRLTAKEGMLSTATTTSPSSVRRSDEMGAPRRRISVGSSAGHPGAVRSTTRPPAGSKLSSRCRQYRWAVAWIAATAAAVTGSSRSPNSSCRDAANATIRSCRGGSRSSQPASSCTRALITSPASPTAATRGSRFAGGGMGQHGDRAPAWRPCESTVSPPTVAVFTSGTEGYHTFRIPALLVLGDDHVLAFAEARREGAADSGEIDLVQRRSEDRGRTWGPLELVRRWPGHTCGNPAPVRTTDSGLVLLSMTNGAEATEDDILAGRVAPDQGRRAWVQRSDDLGRSWTEPAEITEAVSRPGWRWYATGPARGLQLTDGRILVPANHSGP